MGRNIWNYDSAKEALKNYSSRGDVKANNSSLYQWVHYRKLQDELFSIYTPKHVNWTVESVHKEANKYTHLIDFNNSSNSALAWARKNKCFEIISSHFVPKGRGRKFDGTEGRSGLYFLYDGPEIVYIGKSECTIAHRLYTHSREGLKTFNKIIVYLIDNPADVSIAEMYLINRHNPKYNKESNSGIATTLEIVNLNSIISQELTFNVSSKEDKNNIDKVGS